MDTSGSRATTPGTPKNLDREIAALAVFAAELAAMDDNGKRACILWLADYFLGWNLWGKR